MTLTYCSTVLFMGQIGRELRWGIHYGKSYVGGTSRGADKKNHHRSQITEAELKMDRSEEQTRSGIERRRDYKTRTISWAFFFGTKAFVVIII